MESNIDLSSVATVTGHASYKWNLRLAEFNGECAIYYNTDCPLLAGGYIHLVTIENNSFAANIAAKPEGGVFYTGKPWGSGWYAMWAQKTVEGNDTVLLRTPTTK